MTQEREATMAEGSTRGYFSVKPIKGSVERNRCPFNERRAEATRGKTGSSVIASRRLPLSIDRQPFSSSTARHNTRSLTFGHRRAAREPSFPSRVIAFSFFPIRTSGVRTGITGTRSAAHSHYLTSSERYKEQLACMQVHV